MHVLFFQAEDGIRDVERSRGLGDVYKRQVHIVESIILSNFCSIMLFKSLLAFEI